MPLKSLDLYICLKLATPKTEFWTYAQLGEALGVSASETNAAVKRSLSAGLLVPPLSSEKKPGPMVQALMEFIEHGVRYAFFESPGAIKRGMPTAHSAPPLNTVIQQDDRSVLVWPDPEGETRGQEFLPLHKSAPAAARRDPALYRLLALVDAIRGGRSRERQLGFQLLADLLSSTHGV